MCCLNLKANEVSSSVPGEEEVSSAGPRLPAICHCFWPLLHIPCCLPIHQEEEREVSQGDLAKWTLFLYNPGVHRQELGP